MMHVLVLPSWYSTLETPWRGTFFENQAVGLARAGARVGVAFVEPRSLRALSLSTLRQSHFQVAVSEDQGVTSLRLKGWNTVMQTAAGAGLWARLSDRLVRTYIDRFGIPDIIHAHAAHWAGRVAVRAGRRLSRPSVVTEHSSAVLSGALTNAQWREARRVYRAADAVLAVSRALSNAVDAIADGRRSRVVPNAVDVQFFTLPPTPRRRDPFTFLAVCNLVRGKGVDRLLRAFELASAARPGLRLVIAGTGPEAGALRHLARQSSVAESVEFTGGLPPLEVRERMWRANALVLASDLETFGVVLVEALATGIPVVSTRSGGPEDVVDREVGRLVDKDDGRLLAEAMLKVTAEDWPEARLRERVVDRFSLERVAAELLDVYAALLRNRNWGVGAGRQEGPSAAAPPAARPHIVERLLA